MIVCAHVPGDNPASHPLYNALAEMSGQFPNDRVIVFCEVPVPETDNLSARIIDPLRLRYLPPFSKDGLPQWYRLKLPELLKEYGADCFVSAAGLLPKKDKAALFLYDAGLSFFDEAGANTRTTRALAGADKLFVTEGAIADRLSETLGNANIVNLGHGIDSIAASASAILLKEKFTDGSDFFLCPVDAAVRPKLLTILKGFSRLKKRQKTSIKLVFLNLDDDETFIPNLENYRYREDVKIIALQEKNADALPAAAYAVLSFEAYSPGSILFRALKNGEAIIAEHTEINRAIFAEAVLFSAADEEAIGEKMQLLYRDELLKNNLGEAAKRCAESYDIRTTARLLHEALPELTSNFIKTTR